MKVIEPKPVILAATAWKTNAELIADVAALHLKEEWLAVDLTFGRGVWWKEWCPSGLVTNDLYADGGVGVDFTSCPPEWECLFDLVAYDPPYVVMGSPSRSAASGDNAQDVADAYGLKRDNASKPEDLQVVINAGLSEAYRITRCGGLVIVKCQDFMAHSGQYWPGTYWTLAHALGLGFKLVDRFEMIYKPRPQPSGITQRHARRNLSTLFVLKKVSGGGD